MQKRKLKSILSLLLILSLLTACSLQKQPKEGAAQTTGQPGEDETGSSLTENGADGEGKEGEASAGAPGNEKSGTGGRPALIGSMEESGEISVSPCVEPYTIESDLSNVYNLEQFYFSDEEMIDKLAKNGFVVCGSAGNEFFEIYEINRYSNIPNFVTVDSLMHTYHLYFSYLLKNIERDYLSDSIRQLSLKMLDNSAALYEQLKGSAWESAAARNAAFFTIGAMLLGEEPEVKAYVQDMVQQELDRIKQADWIYKSEITGDEEDYTQYIPRGYYAGDQKLEQYFQAMMWYGRIHFAQENEEMERSALLITKALTEDEKAYELWESIYAVTSFFAGASDDLGVCEYAPAAQKAFGEDISLEVLISDEEAFRQFHAMTGELPLPQINSIPIMDGEDNVIPGFRFMGQRFTIDAAIMQKMIYSDVKENSSGDKRMLPDVLDVPAALGSDMALTILKEQGAVEFSGYGENMEQLKKFLSQENDTLWSSSLYAGWLHTLRPLLVPKGEGYPVFMQSKEWTKKNLECFAGSFTELKHDTVLYSKQVIAEMGGDYIEDIDSRGYVEPEPYVYARFAALAGETSKGLKAYGMLSQADEENLFILYEIADRLWKISNKELKDEVLSAEDYDFIQCYGGNLEHFWYETVKEETEDMVSTQECPAAVVVDIATNPNGIVLEAATGNPSVIYVVVKVDGKIKIAKGSVYSFYQFSWPLEDRLTDAKWRQMLGIQADENGNHNYDLSIPKPDWTGSYRFKYAWE